MSCFIDVPTTTVQSTYVNVEQIQTVREATPTELHGKKGPITTLTLQNDVRVYVKGYVTAVMQEVKACGQALSKVNIEKTKKKNTKTGKEIMVYP